MDRARPLTYVDTTALLKLVNSEESGTAALQAYLEATAARATGVAVTVPM